MKRYGNLLQNGALDHVIRVVILFSVQVSAYYPCQSRRTVTEPRFERLLVPGGTLADQKGRYRHRVKGRIVKSHWPNAGQRAVFERAATVDGGRSAGIERQIKRSPHAAANRAVDVDRCRVQR